MSDSWLDLTDEEREEQIINIAKDETGITNFNKYGVFFKFLGVLITIVNKIYSLINVLKRQCNLDEATGVFLDLWGIIVGCIRLTATKTIRQFLCTTYASGTVTAGNWINITGTDLRFKTLTDVSFTGNSQFYISAEAEFEGLEYNMSSNYDVSFSKVISGIDAVSIPSEDGYITTLGRDSEENDVYRVRVKTKWKSLNENIVKAKYKTVALSITGVIDANIIRTPRGAGSVDIVIAVASGYNDDEIIYNVAQALESQEVVCRDHYVRLASDKLVNLQVSFIGNFEESTVRAKVEAFFQKQKIGNNVIYANSTTDSLYFYLLNELKFNKLIISPASDIEVTAYEIARINNLEVNKL